MGKSVLLKCKRLYCTFELKHGGRESSHYNRDPYMLIKWDNVKIIDVWGN